MHFLFDYLCSVATYDIIFCCRPVYYKTLIQWNSLIYTLLKPSNDVTSLVKVHGEYEPAIQNLTRFVTSFLWLQSSTNQAVS